MLLGLVALRPLPAAAEALGGLIVGAGQFGFMAPMAEGPRTMRVFYYLPPGARPDTPVVVVLHGVNRDAGDYRDQWIDAAREHGFLVLAPEFSKADFPDAEAYNLGNVFAPDGRLNPKPLWSFSLIGQAFDKAMSLAGSVCRKFGLYGHSAGAQFVHRMVTLFPDDKIGTAIAANAGWYTLPLADVDWPYGLKGGPPVAPEALKAALGRKLIVLLGGADTDPNHKFLRNTPQAKAQGPHRLARGKNYFAHAGALAGRLGAAFNWELRVVEGVGHSNSRMAAWAARLFAARPSC